MSTKNKKKRTCTGKARARSAQTWTGLQNLTSLLGRAEGVIKDESGTEFIKEDIAALQIANKYKI